MNVELKFQNLGKTFLQGSICVTSTCEPHTFEAGLNQTVTNAPPPVRLTRKAKYVTMTVSLCKVQRLTSLRCRGVVNAMARDRWLTKEEGTKQTDIVSSSAWWLMGALGSFVNPSITTWLTHSPWFWSLYFMTGTVKHVFLHHGWHFAAPEGMSDLVSK